MNALRTLVLLTISIFAALALAAPMVPGEAPMPPDEVLSTANLTRARLEVAAPPRAIRAAGLDEKAIADRLRALFKAQRIEIVKDADAPMVKVQVLLMVDPNTPNALSILCFLEFHQEVTLPRLDGRKLFVPTVTLLNPGPATPDTLGKTSETLLDGLARQFIESVNRASLALAK